MEWGATISFVVYLHRCHDGLGPFVVQFQNAIQNGDLVVPQRLLALPVELQERLEFCLLVGVGLVCAKDVIKQFGYRPRDGC